MTDCLLYIDVQNGFVSEKTEHILPRLQSISDKFDHVIATKFFNTKNGPYTRVMSWYKLMDSPETDLISFVKESSEKIFEKNIYSAVSDELISFIRDNKIDTVYITGIDTDCCVLKTAVDLFERNIDFKVLVDYTASNGGKESFDAAVKVMQRLIGDSSLIFGDYKKK